MQVEGQHKCSNAWVATGARVRNTYVTWLLHGDSLKKFGLIPDIILVPEGIGMKGSQDAGKR